LKVFHCFPLGLPHRLPANTAPRGLYSHAAHCK
jgi:hypothetical protein